MSSSSMLFFRQRLIAGEALIGCFLKTPSPIVCEVLGLSSLDVVCIDAEHAPFERLGIDSCISAFRGSAMPSLVRVPCGAPSHILGALDCGATGVVIPHVCSAEQAESISLAARYGRGGRGYATSTRAAGYSSKSMPAHLTDSAAQTTVIAMIEDIEAVEAIDEIAAVEGIDCLFIGCIDLTVALAVDSPNDPAVVTMLEKICAAGRAAGKAVGMFVPKVEEAAKWQERGVSLFLLSSDHGFLRQGANDLVTAFRGD